MHEFKTLGINHVGLAPKDPVKAKAFLQEVLGMVFLGEELVKDQQTQTIMFASGGAAGDADSRLEILAPEAGTLGPIAQFLAKRGAGIHHLAITVDDVQAAVSALLARGVKMIDQVPRNGAHQTRIAFVHPEATGGLLLELVQNKG